MAEVQTLSYSTNLTSLSEIQSIRQILDNNPDVEYWHIDINSPQNTLMLMGNHLEEVILILKHKGYIADT